MVCYITIFFRMFVIMYFASFEVRLIIVILFIGNRENEIIKYLKKYKWSYSLSQVPQWRGNERKHFEKCQFDILDTLNVIESLPRRFQVTPLFYLLYVFMGVLTILIQSCFLLKSLCRYVQRRNRGSCLWITTRMSCTANVGQWTNRRYVLESTWF